MGSKKINPEAKSTHPTWWHGPVASRLRQVYAHRHALAKINPDVSNIIGIPWSEWAALSDERSLRLKGHPCSSLDAQTGVDCQGKSYDDAIPVWAESWEKGTDRGPDFTDAPVGGTVWLWFYPKP